MAQSHRYKGNVDHINFSSRQGDTSKDPDTKGGLHIYLVSKFATNMQLGLRDWELICYLSGHAVCKHIHTVVCKLDFAKWPIVAHNVTFKQCLQASA